VPSAFQQELAPARRWDGSLDQSLGQVRVIVAAPQDPVTEGSILDTQNAAAPATETGAEVGMVVVKRPRRKTESCRAPVQNARSRRPGRKRSEVRRVTDCQLRGHRAKSTRGTRLPPMPD